MSALTQVDELTSFCKATADTLRMQVLRVLARESFGVLELCQIMDMTQPAMSHHLKILSQSGYVESRRQGTSIYYRRALVSRDDPFESLRRETLQSIDELPLSKSLVDRTRQVYRERQKQAKTFFEKHAGNLKENQDLIAEYSHYQGCISDLLTGCELIDSDIIEIGSGESDLIVDLAAHAKHVLVVDNTEEMLDRTRGKVAAAKLPNISFFHGELQDVSMPSSPDLIVLNMVLHHLASPPQLFHEASSRLNKNGYLLIAELCAHDQAWTRDICGDLWLGFDADEMDNWALAAGLTPSMSAFIGLKTGFQVQARLFQKNTTT